MEFLDRDVKEMPSLLYTEYFEGTQSCVCCECKAPIKAEKDYLLDNNEVSELPHVYLLCECSECLWLPLVKDCLPDPKGETVTADDLNKGVLWRLHNPNPSKYANNKKVRFTKCQKKEEVFFLRSYIKANIDPCQKMEGKLESLAKDYYKLCHDTIELNLKLGLLNAFLTDRLAHFWVSGRSGLKNSTYDLVQYSSPIFWEDYVSTYFDSCIVRIYRLMEGSPQEHTNSYHRYKNRYLEHYPKQKSKSGICKIDPRLKKIRDHYIAHNDRRFYLEETQLEKLKEALAVLYDSYTNEVLKSINTLNKMQGLKIVFSYDPRKTLSHKGAAIRILKFMDNELERNKNADWVGRWSVKSADGMRLEGSFGVSSTYEFCSDGTFELKSATKVEGEGLSLSETIIARGSYTFTDDSYSMKVENAERTSFVRRSGTWVRDGDTLTLTVNDDGVVVLKKD